MVKRHKQTSHLRKDKDAKGIAALAHVCPSQRKEDLRSHANLYTNAQSSFIWNSHKLGMTPVPFCGWMSKEIVLNQ